MANKFTPFTRPNGFQVESATTIDRNLYKREIIDYIYGDCGEFDSYNELLERLIKEHDFEATKKRLTISDQALN